MNICHGNLTVVTLYSRWFSVNIQLHIDFTMNSKRSIQVQLNYETRQMSRYKYSAGRLTQTPGTYRVCSNYEMF